MTSVLNNEKYLTRYWAALNGDFASLEKLFLRSPGWTFKDFAKCCVTMNITLIMHSTIGRGIGWVEHYAKSTNVILQAAKSFWLSPYTSDSYGQDEGLDLKRRIFGCYLTYLMYMKQPYKGRVKIVMGLKDLEIALLWKEKIKGLQLADEIDYIIEDLALREAFQFQLLPYSLGFDEETRNLLNVTGSRTIPLIREMKNAQDDLSFSGLIDKTESFFVEYQSMKIDVAKKLELFSLDDAEGKQDDKEKSKLENGESRDSKMHTMLKSCSGGEDWVQGMEKVTTQCDQPIFTIQNLTANADIDLKLMTETEKRIERTRKKAMNEDCLPKVSKPYINAGGVFGRTKETPKASERKSERHLGSPNVWAWIDGDSLEN